jgi:transcriptional regulator with GAF, ATPase, and Fis domain
VGRTEPNLLILASESSTRLDTLLAAVLDKALAVSARTIGGAVIVTEPAPHQAILHRLAADRVVPEVLSWIRDPRSLVFATPAGCSPVHVTVLPLLGIRAGSTALVVPIVECRARYGTILVELRRVEGVDGSDRAIRGALEDLANEATEAIRRFRARDHSARMGFELDLVGVSRAFLDLERQARLAASSPCASVLVLGERGTGKEMIARSIHAWSDRRDAPFVPVLASGLAETLIPDELYGHERHAFTGADRPRAGRFKAANGGTLFLDEIADMPPGVQAMLLRVAERGEIQPIGADGPDTVDVRIIAATNVDLRKRAEQHEFRADLYDRLSIFQIYVPPLRERREDIPLMAMYYARKYCRVVGRSMNCRFAGKSCTWAADLPCVSPEFLAALVLYDWPGNVRELANLMQRLVVTVDDEILDAGHLPPRREHVLHSGGSGADMEMGATGRGADLRLDSAIRRHIERVLEIADQRQSRAARLLDLPYSTLQSTMKRFGIRMRPRRDPPE